MVCRRQRYVLIAAPRWERGRPARIARYALRRAPKVARSYHPGQPSLRLSSRMNLRTFVSHTAAGSFALLCGSRALLFGAAPPVAQPYKLAEIMALAGGTKVTNVASWTQRRRPELLEFFTANIYGRAPARPEGLTFKVVEQDPLALNGKALRREVDISLPGSRGTFAFRLVVFLPNAAKQPAPAFLLLNHRGDVHTQVNEAFFPVRGSLSAATPLPGSRWANFLRTMRPGIGRASWAFSMDLTIARLIRGERSPRGRGAGVGRWTTSRPTRILMRNA